MGHLTVLGAVTSESERDIHVGNLGAVGADVFAGFEYTALGHLHRPQKVAGLEGVRYSGSPIALSFSEAGDAKSVVVVDTAGGRQRNADRGMGVEMVAVPVSRSLVRVKAGRASLGADLESVPAGAWAEVSVKLEGPEADLDRMVREAAAGRFEVLKVLAELPAGTGVVWQATGPVLSELQPREVFEELLKEKGMEGEELRGVFGELMALREARVTG
jgi:exonuclease SbcD